jgi:uncharacterized protein YgfB (UPF0149 family)
MLASRAEALAEWCRHLLSSKLALAAPVTAFLEIDVGNGHPLGL